MASTPTSNAVAGSAQPAPPRRRTTSYVAIGMASANMTSHPLGANRRTAIAIAPRVVPTAMAAGRLRPARDFLGVSGAATEFSRRSVRSDLEQLAFLVLDELVDLPDILV